MNEKLLNYLYFKECEKSKIVINEKIIRYLVKFLNIFINLPLNQRIIDILISQRDFKIDKIRIILDLSHIQSYIMV